MSGLIFISLFLIQGFLVESSAHAKTSECDSYLTSILNESEKSDDAAQAFVRLVKYYFDQPVDDRNKTEVIEKISGSDQFINPFNGSYGSLELQLERAVQKILSQSHDLPEQWRDIQKSVTDLTKSYKVEFEDREQKSKETSAVFNPRVLQSLPEPMSIHSNPVWFKSKDGHEYLLVVVDGIHIKLYVLENGSLQSVDEFQVVKNSVAPLTMHVTADGREILTVHQRISDDSDGLMVDFFELSNRKLRRVQTNLSESIVIGRALWFTDNDKDQFLTFDPRGNINLYEFVNGQFQLKQELHVTDFKAFQASLVLHKSFDGNSYLTVGTNLYRSMGTQRESMLHLYRYSSGNFVHSDSKPLASRWTWHTDRKTHKDYILMFVGQGLPGSYKLYIYQLQNDKMEMLDSKPLDFWEVWEPETPIWRRSPSGKEWAIIGSKGKSFAFEFVDEKFIKKELGFEDLNPASNPNWHIGRDPVLTFNVDSRLVFYREENDLIYLARELKFDESIKHCSIGPSHSMWVDSSDGRTYSAVVTKRTLHLISLYDRVQPRPQAQGGAR